MRGFYVGDILVDFIMSAEKGDLVTARKRRDEDAALQDGKSHAPEMSGKCVALSLLLFRNVEENDSPCIVPNIALRNLK